MTRFIIFRDEELVVFSHQFIPDYCMMRLPKGDEEPTINPNDGEVGIYTVLFE